MTGQKSKDSERLIRIPLEGEPGGRQLYTRREILRVGGLSAAAVGLLAACQNGEILATTTTLGNTTTVGPGTTGATSASTSTLPEVVRGTIQWAASGPVRKLDPQPQTGNGIERRVYEMLFDYITARDADFNLVPGVASAWEMVDETTWDFELRSDVLFHNSEPVTASDIKFSLERLVDPEVESGYATSFVTIAAIEAAEDNLLRITTDGPDPLLPGRLAWWPAWILPEAYFNEVGPEMFNIEPVGSGPYVLESFDPGVELVVRVNDQYWRGTANADELSVTERAEPAARLTALLAGESNMIDRVGFDQIQQIEDNTDTKAVTEASRSQWMLIPNAELPHLADKQIRQAMSLAIDRQAIVDSLLQGFGRISTGPLVPGDLAFDESAPPLSYDPDAAAALVSESGYSGEEIVLEYSPNLIYAQDGDISLTVSEMWKQVGLNVSVKEIELSTYVEKITGRNWEGVFVTGVSSSLGDPDGSVWRVMQEGGSLRYWTNEEFDRLGAEAHSSTDNELRETNYRTMVEIMLEEMPWITLFETIQVYGLAESINLDPSLSDLFSAERLTFSG